MHQRGPGYSFRELWLETILPNAVNVYYVNIDIVKAGYSWLYYEPRIACTRHVACKQ